MTTYENKVNELATAKDTFATCAEKIRVMEIICNSDFDFAAFEDMIEEALSDLVSEVDAARIDVARAEDNERNSDYMGSVL